VHKAQVQTSQLHWPIAQTSN